MAAKAKTKFSMATGNNPNYPESINRVISLFEGLKTEREEALNDSPFITDPELYQHAFDYAVREAKTSGNARTVYVTGFYRRPLDKEFPALCFEAYIEKSGQVFLYAREILAEFGADGVLIEVTSLGENRSGPIRPDQIEEAILRLVFDYMPEHPAKERAMRAAAATLLHGKLTGPDMEHVPDPIP